MDIHALPQGYIVITSPEVRDLCAALEAQRATWIRTDGVALASVNRLTEKDYVVQQMEAAGRSANPDPDLDETD